VLGGGGPEFGGPHTGLDPGGTGAGLDADLLHPLSLDEDRPPQIRERGGAMTRRLSGDAQPALSREAEHLRHVVSAVDERDRRRLQVCGEVHAQSDLIPVGVLRRGNPSVDR
jgi:hypothetical protein